MISVENYKKQMDQIQSKYEKESLAIKLNSDLTGGAKSEKVRAVKEDRDSAVANLREQRKQEMIQRKDLLYSEMVVLRHAATASDTDRATKESLYQAAIERAEKTKDGEELENLLLIAQQTGNQTLIQAIGYVSFETQYYDIARAALTSNNTGKARKFDELIELKNALEQPSYKQMMDEGSLFAV